MTTSVTEQLLATSRTVTYRLRKGEPCSKAKSSAALQALSGLSYVDVVSGARRPMVVNIAKPNNSRAVVEAAFDHGSSRLDDSQWLKD